MIHLKGVRKAKLRQLIINHHPDLKKKFDSKQYELSNKLIEIKLSNKLTQLEMSRLGEVTYSEYLEMEFGDMNYSVENYLNLIDKIKGGIINDL